MNEIIRRYIIFTAGLIFTALGVAFATESCLGPSPISAIPYSLWCIMPKLSMGEWTIIFNVLLVLLQIVIQRKAVNKIQLGLQLIITIPFGYLIDFWLICLEPVAPQNYPMQLVFTLIGCAVVAFGVYIQVVGNVVMLPGDAFVRAVAKASGREFGKIRMASDITMVVTAFALCFAFLGGLEGVREGTVIAAFLVGTLVRVYTKKLGWLKDRLLNAKGSNA